MTPDPQLVEELALIIALAERDHHRGVCDCPDGPRPGHWTRRAAADVQAHLQKRGRLVPDDGPEICAAEDHGRCGDTCCQRCRAVNIVWFTDSPIWNKVMPDGGVLCVRCFVLAAEAAGVGTKSAWLVVPEFDEAGRPRLVPDGAGKTVKDCGCPIRYAVAKLEEHTRECGSRKAAARLAKYLDDEYGEPVSPTQENTDAHRPPARTSPRRVRRRPGTVAGRDARRL